MKWRGNYEWLMDFWNVVVADRRDRVWQITSLSTNDIWLRDAFACERLHDRLRDRRGRVVHAYVPDAREEPQIDFRDVPKRDMIFVGRTKTFQSSRFSVGAMTLRNKMCARFHDATDGRLGNTVEYGKRRFTRHDLDTPPGQPRRTDIDYAVLAYREADADFQRRRLLAIAGLSSLGTLGLTLILVDDDRRRELVRQVREVAPWDPRLDPEKRFEICVRIEVESEEKLTNFLNQPEFSFQVEVVVIGDAEPILRNDKRQLVLHPDHGDRGTVTIEGSRDEVAVPAMPFRALRFQVERGGSATPRELCIGLELQEKDASSEQERRARAHLAKIVHDLNRVLARLPGLGAQRAVQMSKGKDKKYQLVGIQGVIRDRTPRA